MRMTVQYAMVLDAVRQLQCHATAEEIHEYVLTRNPHISKGTVYRNLNRLCQLGEITRRELPGGADGYDHRPGRHYHARCEKCSRLFDVDMEYRANLIGQIKDSHGFFYTDMDIVFKCICPECQSRCPD